MSVFGITLIYILSDSLKQQIRIAFCVDFTEILQ